jgi:hypothetical protein
MTSTLMSEVLHLSLKFNVSSISYCKINKLKLLERLVIKVQIYIVASVQPLHKSLFF